MSQAPVQPVITLEQHILNLLTDHQRVPLTPVVITGLVAHIMHPVNQIMTEKDQALLLVRDELDALKKDFESLKESLAPEPQEES